MVITQQESRPQWVAHVRRRSSGLVAPTRPAFAAASRGRCRRLPTATRRRWRRAREQGFTVDDLLVQCEVEVVHTVGDGVEIVWIVAEGHLQVAGQGDVISGAGKTAVDEGIAAGALIDANAGLEERAAQVSGTEGNHVTERAGGLGRVGPREMRAPPRSSSKGMPPVAPVLLSIQPWTTRSVVLVRVQGPPPPSAAARACTLPPIWPPGSM